VAITSTDIGIQPMGQYLQAELLRLYRLPLALGSKKTARRVVLAYSMKVAAVAGAYRLSVTQNEVAISARDNEGIFNGITTLIQLIKDESKTGTALKLDCWEIDDQPLYTWRGLMLDESRHFFGKKKVKQLLDWMAFYKLNRFHWHLTDQQGWRLEIKQYPKLALVGGIGDFDDAQAPAAYYTQEDVKEIVAYAATRFITIIPEIDMPGHATAANRAYPEFSGGGSKSFPDFTFNPGKDPTYQYLSNILKETDVLFPSQLIHIGGDEVHFGNEKWKTDVDVSRLMQRESLPDLKAVEHYFFKRIADSVLKLNNKVLAWDEVAESNLPTNETIVFWWRHDKPRQLQIALDRGFSVVLCPRLPFYFNYQQDSLQVYGPDWKKFGLNSIENIYRFNQSQLSVVFPKSPLVLGIQANLWTEFVKSEQKLDYLMYPRMAALAEVAWTSAERKNYKQFSTRLAYHFSLYEKAGLYYFNPFNRQLTGEPKQ
jgi:hexosaminidase